MATTPSIKIVKTFTYRGVLRRVSNRYHFNGGTPADTAHWTTLSDAVVAAEKATIEASSATIVQGVGYAAGSDVPVFTKTYATAGTGAFANFSQLPGDVAAVVRYATAARTSKNHPVYLFNYYHAVGDQNSSADSDLLNTAQRAALGTYAAAWISGFSDGTITAVRAGPRGATATGQLVELYVSHRDLPRV